VGALHLRAARGGVRIEIISVVWMVIEGAVAIGAGIAAGSLLLTAFGIDSVIELVSAAVLLWRLAAEVRGGTSAGVERAERRAVRVVAVCLALLCVYVLVSAIYGLITQSRPDASVPGITIAALAVAIMPWLAVSKRRIAARMDSAALRGDAASSITCAYMAATVLGGLLLNALFHWWWAEDVAAFLFLFWLARETWEAIEEARGESQD
jgi:divalent metal cation (Fe/Co/Zn/Cd) transporter